MSYRAFIARDGVLLGTVEATSIEELKTEAAALAGGPVEWLIL